ncbi:MAG: protein kinase [Anaerolineae bacterium]|nr:protein kinase [Anaerolineae bacterium]
MLAGRYDIQDVLGTGGMGMVYLGEDTVTEQQVAIKLLKPEAIERDPSVLERFIREGEALRRLDHPTIVKMLDAVEKDGNHFLIMEYVSGGSLKQLLHVQPQLPITRIVEIALDIADALTRAHRLKIIHRDIKPANVLLAEDGTPRLADFGVAYMEAKERVTQTGVAMGTIDYICPEALTGEMADTRADIWSLGVMLFEMVAGQRPFTGDASTQVLLAIMTQLTPDVEALRPECPVALADLIYRMLEKDPEARIPSIRLVGAELEAILNGIDLEVDTAVFARPRFPVGPSNDTPTLTLSRVKNNLPAQTSQFVGREDEITEIGRLLGDNNIRLVTILAPGGMGKTRLALEIAARQFADFPDGVFFIQLAPVASVDGIIPALADAMKVEALDAERTLKQQVFDYLREKRILLLLDNFEHLVDGAEIASEILEAAPEVEIIATSRTRLHLRTETVFTLEGIDFPEWESPENALEYGAVKLFMQSARREDPAFDLEEEDLQHVARICWLLQGMPLGIMLAAAWIDTLSLEEIAAEISQSLDFLESDMRDMPERHQSIRAVFDYSWSLLNPKEREAFVRLSVFRGGMSRQAAQAITGATLRILMALVDKSLLRRDPRTGRYEIHELLRQYAAEQLESAGEVEAMQAAHAAYYARAMQQLESDLKGHRQVSALNEIQAEFDNGRAAWDWAVTNQRLDLIDQAIESLYLFCNMRSRWQSAEDMFRKAIERLAPQSDDVPSPEWGRVIARYYKQNVNVEQVEQALEIARQHDDPPELAFCNFALGWALYDVRRYEEAVNYYEESLRQFQALDDHYYVATIYSSLGVWHASAGHTDQAVDYFRRSLELRRRLGDRAGVAESLQNLSAPMIFKGRLAEAEQFTREAHTISLETGSLADIAFSSATLAGLALWRGDFERAHDLVEQALRIARDINYDKRRGYALVILGNLACAEGNYEEARQLCEEGRPLAAGNPLVAYIADIGLANAAAGLGDYATAQRHTLTALKLVLALKNLAFVAACIPSAAAVLEKQGEKTRATALLGLAFSQPAAANGWMNKWKLLDELRARLQADLGREAYLAAWDSGKLLDMQSVAMELLQEKV